MKAEHTQEGPKLDANLGYIPRPIWLKNSKSIYK